MPETISVNFTGPALAFLMYENANARQEQEGFLLGDTHVVLKSTVTDTDRHKVHTSKFINVKAIVACPSTCLFYNGAGQIDKEKLKAIIGSQMNVVVGWFKYDPSSNLRLTLRGTILHKEISKIFNIAPELFTCCLLTATCSQNNSTHTYTHKLLRYENGQFETVPMHIENLGDPSNNYKPKSPASPTFLRMCESLGASRDSELHIVSDIQDNLQNKIVTAMVDLVKSERKKTQLEREVKHLRQLVETRRAQLAEEALAKEMQMKAAVTHENICFLVDEENNEMADALEQMNNTNSNKQICPDAGTSLEVKGGQKTSKKVQKNKRKADAMKTKNKTEGDSDVSSTNTNTESLPAVNNPMDGTSQLVDLTLSDGDEHIPSSATNTCTSTSVAAAVAEQPMKSTYAQAIATKTKPKRNK